MKTDGSAVWSGGIKDGKGAISTKSGALKEYPTLTTPAMMARTISIAFNLICSA